MQQVIVYDPTASDEASRVRGVGRYLQLLRENFPDWKFINSLKIENFKLKILVNPFINFLQPPVITQHIAEKQIAIIHDLIPLKYPSHFPAGMRGAFNVFRNKQALKYYDTIVTDSEASKRDIVRMLRIPSDRVPVIYPTLPKIFQQVHGSRSTVHSNSSAANSELRTVNYFLYVGDVTWNKNLVNLARAIKQADVTCVFVGKAFGNAGGIQTYIRNSTRGPGASPRSAGTPSIGGERTEGESGTKKWPLNPWLNEFNQFINEAKDDSRFIFPGFVKDEELLSLYKGAIANILVSRDEGFGLSYLEAAACGTPSILSDIPVFHEIAGDTALFVNANDPYSLVEALKLALKSKKKLVSGLKERANNFDQVRFVSEWQKVLGESK